MSKNPSNELAISLLTKVANSCFETMVNLIQNEAITSRNSLQWQYDFMQEKLMKINNVHGGWTYRPRRQDIKPKAFPNTALLMLSAYELPSDRRMLWIIYHYPYVLNVFFRQDWIDAGGFKIIEDKESRLNQCLKIIHNLSVRGLIKQTNDNLEWHITLKGYLFRTTSHPGALLIAPATAILIFILTRIFPIGNKSTTIDPRTNKDLLPVDSVVRNQPQIDSPKVKDYVSLPSDTTKRKDTTKKK